MTNTSHRMTHAERAALHIRRAIRKAWRALPYAMTAALAAFGCFALCLLILETR